jgi:hypothetical protein
MHMDSSEDSGQAQSAGPPRDGRVEIAPGPFAWAEQVASRYFSIWVWSIVVGVTTSTTFSVTNYVVRSKGSFINLLIVPLYALSAVALLSGWWGTIRFFDTYILQLFLGRRPGDGDPKELAERDFDERYRAGRYLRMAVRFAFVGLAFRLLLSLADILLSSLPY